MHSALKWVGTIGLFLGSVCVAADTSKDGHESVPEELRPFFASEEFRGRETGRMFPAGSQRIVALAISSDRSVIVSCNRDGVCQATDVKTRKPLGSYERDLEGEKFCVAVSGDGRLAAIGGEFQAVHVWDTRTGEHKFTHGDLKSTVLSVGISDDAKWMIASTDDGAVFRFPLLGGLGNVISMGPLAPRYDVFSVSPDGEAAVGTCNGGMTSIVIFPKPSPKPSPVPALEELRGPNGEQIALAFLARQGLKPFDHFRGPFTAAGSSQELAAWVGPSRRVTVIPIRRGKLKLSPYRRTSLNFRDARAVAISPDNERLIAVNLDGKVDAIALPTLQRIRSIVIKPGDATAAAVSRDCRLVAFGYRDGYIALFERDPIPDPPAVVFRETVLAARDRQDYALLEQLAEWLGDGPEPFDWSLRVTRYSQLIRDLKRLPLDWHAKPDAGPSLEQWAKKRPESALVRLSLTSKYIADAWKARGSGFARQVTEEGWREFARHLDKAESVLSEIEVTDSTPPEFFRLAIILAQAQGGGRQRFNQLTAQLMKYAPKYAPAHQAAAEYLLPRWHGERGEIAGYADRVSDRIGGVQGDIIYAQVATKIAGFGLAGVEHREFFLAHELDLPRVRRGLEALRESRPNDPTLLCDLLYHAWLEEDRAVALRVLKEYQALVNPPPKLWDRPVSVGAIRAWAQESQE